MIFFDLVIMFFATILLIGQGRVALRNFSVREAGWGRHRFEQAINPKGFWAMATLDAFLFAALCVWLWLGAQELLQ